MKTMAFGTFKRSSRTPNYSEIRAAVTAAARSRYHKWTINAVGGIQVVVTAFNAALLAVQHFDQKAQYELQRRVSEMMQASSMNRTLNSRISSMCAAVCRNL